MVAMGTELCVVSLVAVTGTVMGVLSVAMATGC